MSMLMLMKASKKMYDITELLRFLLRLGNRYMSVVISVEIVCGIRYWACEITVIVGFIICLHKPSMRNIYM